MAQAHVDLVISRWNTLIGGLQVSSKDFYSSVHEAINTQNLADLKISRVHWKEGGVFSAKREYLRIRRKGHIFDICGAPYGNGFFVSWWLGGTQSNFIGAILRIPFFGPLLEYLFSPLTYYKIDTAMMFQQVIHSCVLEIVDRLTKAEGIRGLTELERKPIMRDFYNK